MLYPLIKPLLFALDAEEAHETSLQLLNQFRYLMPKTRCLKPVKLMGLNFPNPVGLAAGMDKNGDYLPGLSKLGFGFIEVGTVTPRPQTGNLKPRLFRLSQYNSIINRMGFNNKGTDHLLAQLKDQPRDFVLGINIGKNLNTSVNNALVDYVEAFTSVYSSADYITINISSPNTPGLRGLQSEDALDQLLNGITEQRKKMQDKYGYNRSIALKVSPDLDPGAIRPIAELLLKHKIDALIATNTTLDRSLVKDHVLANEAGGLSGDALTLKSRDILVQFYQILQHDIPIISVGGISSAEEAKLRLELGAKLVQIYSGLIFQGSGLVRQIIKAV